MTSAAADLLRVPTGTRTEAGLRHNIRVGVQYLEAWLRGNGCVPLYNLMEDAATAEISRTQVWQWIRHGAALDDGRPVTVQRFQPRPGRGDGPGPRGSGRGIASRTAASRRRVGLFERALHRRTSSRSS